MKTSVFNNQGFDQLCKIVLVGDSHVGKTSLLVRYLDNEFYQTALQTSTIAIDFRVKDVLINQRRIRFQFWDTAGQERYQSINASYYKGSAAALVVFSIDDQESFTNAKTWLNDVRQEADSHVELILVGTKIDLDRKVDEDRVREFVKKQNVSYCEVSSRNNTGVQELFHQLGEKLIGNNKTMRTSMTTTKLMPQFENKKRSCPC